MSQSAAIKQEVLELVERIYAGKFSPADGVRLNTLLRTNEEARRHYRLFVFIHGELEWTIAPPTAAAPRAKLRERLSPIVRFFANPTPLSLAVATLVVGVLIVGMALVAPPIYQQLARSTQSPAGSTNQVAHVVDLFEPVWADANMSLSRGSPLRMAEQLKLKTGAIEIKFNGGAMIVVEGPAELTLLSANAAKLSRGKLFATVPPQAVGYTLSAPYVTIVDLGTEFGVNVDTQGAAEVQVVKGKVALTIDSPSAGTAARHELSAGESVVVDAAKQFKPRSAPAAVIAQRLPERTSTMLTFSISNPSLRDSAPLPQDYGDYVSNSSVSGAAHTYHYRGVGKFTPQVEVAFSAGNGGAFSYWGTSHWSGGVGYLAGGGEDTRSTRPYYDMTFTPSPNVGVRVQSFVLKDWPTDNSGHEVNWYLYRESPSPANLLAQGEAIQVPADGQVGISIGTTPFTELPLILRIEQISGRGNYLAIDDVHFEQAAIYSHAP